MLFSYFVYIAPFTEFARESFLFQENLCSWKNKKRKKVVGEKKKKKKQLKEERKVLICQEKKKTSTVKVTGTDKEVAVKPKFTIHNVKNELCVSLCKYQP